MPREIEEFLKIVPVFFSGGNIHELWMQMQDIDHFGIIGPLRKGHYLARTPSEALAEVRRVVLGARSQFAQCWGLLIRHKYTARFPAGATDSSVTLSLKASLRWNCVVVARKPAGKGHALLTLGSEEPSPFDQVIYGGEVVLIKPVRESSQSAPLPSKISCPVEKARCPESSEASDSGVSDSLPSAIRSHCDLSVRVLQGQLEQRMNQMESLAANTVSQETQEIAATLDQHVQESKQAIQNLHSQIEKLSHVTESKLAEHQSQALANHRSLETTVSKLAASTQDRCELIEKKVIEQGHSIHASAASFEAKLESFGKDLLAQLAGMSAGPKRQKTGNDDVLMATGPSAGIPSAAPSSHRGGADRFSSSLDRLRQEILETVSPSPNVPCNSSSSSPSLQDPRPAKALRVSESSHAASHDGGLQDVKPEDSRPTSDDGVRSQPCSV